MHDDKLAEYIDNINVSVYNPCQEVIAMTVSEQIKVLCVRCGVSEAELARRLGRSPQSFNAKLKRDTLTVNEMEKIAKVLGVEFKRAFILMNGDEI